MFPVKYRIQISPGFITKQFALHGGELLGGGVLTSHLCNGDVTIERGGKTTPPIPWVMRSFLYEARGGTVGFLGHTGLN